MTTLNRRVTHKQTNKWIIKSFTSLVSLLFRLYHRNFNRDITLNANSTCVFNPISILIVYHICDSRYINLTWAIKDISNISFSVPLLNSIYSNFKVFHSTNTIVYTTLYNYVSHGLNNEFDCVYKHQILVFKNWIKSCYDVYTIKFLNSIIGLKNRIK